MAIAPELVKVQYILDWNKSADTCLKIYSGKSQSTNLPLWLNQEASKEMYLNKREIIW